MNRNALVRNNFNRPRFITEAADLARYSFVLQSSLCCLDLNYCEYSKNVKPIIDFSAYKKENVPRDILDRFHLDNSSKLEFDSKEILIGHSWKASPYLINKPLLLPGPIIIPMPLHYNLDCSIVEYIKQSSDKLGTIRRFLTPIRMLKLYERSSWSVSFFEPFLQVLHQECGPDSSELVVDLMKSFGSQFRKWSLRTKKTDLEFFLWHAQKMGYNIWKRFPSPLAKNPLYRMPVEPLQPVNECCFYGNLCNVGTLIKYGFNFFCSKVFLKEMKENVFRFITPREHDNFIEEMRKNLNIVNRNIRIEGMSLERSCYLFLTVQMFFFVFYVFKSDDTLGLKEALGYIWRATSQPYLYRSEVEAIFKGACEVPAAVMKFDHFYENAIYNGCLTDAYYPRTLSHLCRCEIRKVLGERQQLPHGIDKLQIPTEIKLYLSLGL